MPARAASCAGSAPRAARVAGCSHSSASTLLRHGAGGISDGVPLKRSSPAATLSSGYVKREHSLQRRAWEDLAMASSETTPGRHKDWIGHAGGDAFGPVAGAPIGFGDMRRKEDARFVRGLGDYTDDVRLPGMLHSAILRSPYAHARINSIDTSAALAHPKVAAVVIAKDLETLGLAWMPP